MKDKRQRWHLFVSDQLVGVVEFVGEQLPVARQRFVPAQRHGGGRVGHGLQVGSRAWHLHWEGKQDQNQTAEDGDERDNNEQECTGTKLQSESMRSWSTTRHAGRAAEHKAAAASPASDATVNVLKYQLASDENE